MTRDKHPKPTIDFGYPTPAEGPVPAFNSIEEEAEFWDTHDHTTLARDDADVELVLGPDFHSVLRVPLDASDIDALGKRADELGIEPTALARTWIREHLDEEAS